MPKQSKVILEMKKRLKDDFNSSSATSHSVHSGTRLESKSKLRSSKTKLPPNRFVTETKSNNSSSYETSSLASSGSNCSDGFSNLGNEVLDHIDRNENPDNNENIDDSEADSVAQKSENSEEYRSSSEDISEDETEHLGGGNQARWDSDDETVRLRTTGRTDSLGFKNPSDAETEEALRTVLRSCDQEIRQLRKKLQGRKSLLEKHKRDLKQAQANAREESDVATERANTIAALKMANTNLKKTINRLEDREEGQNSAIEDLNIRLNKALEETRGLANLQVSLGTANGIQNELTVLREKVSLALDENSQIFEKLNNQDARFEELKQLFDEVKSTCIAPVLVSAPSQDRWWISSGTIVRLIISIIIISIALCWNFSLHLIKAI